jgi:hypothetical protein
LGPIYAGPILKKEVVLQPRELEAASGGASGTNNLAKQGAPFIRNAKNAFLAMK